MPLTPFAIVWIWFRGLLAAAIIAGGVASLRAWYDETHVWVPDPGPSEVVAIEPRGPALPSTPPERATTTIPAPAPVSPAVKAPSTAAPAPVAGATPAALAKAGHWVIHWEPGLNRATGLLAAGLLLSTIAVAGRFLLMAWHALRLRKGKDEPVRERSGEVHSIPRPDGTVLHVETYGPKDAPPIVLTHGWGSDGTEFYYEKRNLTDRFRLIIWDLPGLGRSTQPKNKDYSLDKMASDLDAVVGFAGRPCVLLGHSIGGMILLVYARMFPEAMGTRVLGLIPVHTTYHDPIRTMKGAAIKTALEGPLVKPLLALTIGLWPILWVLSWLAFLNGSFHKATRKSAFAGTETRGQVEFVARFLPRDRPDVLARGMFGMIRFDESKSIGSIRVPTLVFVGDRDETTLPEAGRHIAGTIPAATLVTLAPARHMGLIEHHDRFDATVARFAETCLLGLPGTVAR